VKSKADRAVDRPGRVRCGIMVMACKEFVLDLSRTSKRMFLSLWPILVFEKHRAHSKRQEKDKPAKV